MGDTTSVNLRIDKELKQQAESLFATLGINMTTAMNIFLRQAVREQGLPFKVTAATPYNDNFAYRGNASSFNNHEEYIAETLKATDLKVAEGKMKYYTADEIRSGLEEILNGNNIIFYVIDGNEMDVRRILWSGSDIPERMAE